MRYRSAALYAGAMLAGIVVAAAFWLAVDRNAAPSILIAPIPTDALVAVYVGGEVLTPGVYHLPGGARVEDAVAAAGGYTDNAELAELNPAARVGDTDKIIVPSSLAQGVSLRAAADGDFELVNINSAGPAVLETLPGIGPVLASAIVTERLTDGRFVTIYDLQRVDGISASLVEDLRDLITVGE